MKQIELTAEQYDALKQFERHLTTAYRARYVTAIYTSTADKLFNIYNSVYGTNKKATTCMSCVLEVCMKLGKLYFEYQGKQNSEAVEEQSKEVKKPSTKGKKTAKNKTSKKKVKNEDNGRDSQGDSVQDA